MHVLQLVCMLILLCQALTLYCFISLYRSIVNVSIEVQDVNDNSPEFINEPYAAVIIEVCMLNQPTIVIPQNRGDMVFSL